MNKIPLVSVIIPFFNTEKFIGEAIESVLAQTYDHWELLLVDDGSTDGSTKIALEYVRRHPDKVYYSKHNNHENRGISATLNLGIQKAKGTYIAVLDSDDLWLPAKLEQQVVIMDSYPEADLVYGPTHYWYSWTGKPEDIERDFVCELGLQPNMLYKPPTLFVPFFLRADVITPCPCSVMVRREVIDRVGGFEEDFQYIYTDQAFYAKVCLTGAVFVSSECWAKYRRGRRDSCVAAVNWEGRSDAVRLFFLNWIEKYLSEQGVKNPEIWKELQEALWPYHHPRLNAFVESCQYVIRQIEKFVIYAGRRTLPASVRQWMWAKWESVRYNIINPHI